MQRRYGPNPALAAAEAHTDLLESKAITGGGQRHLLNRAIVDRIPQNVRFVMLGEASHGTRDFYDQRAEITKLLILERGFNAVVAESDFPDAYRVNKYARGLTTTDKSAAESLGDYKASAHA
eukprot:jgi/Chrzof1/6695/Cz19g05300.t1